LFDGPQLRVAHDHGVNHREIFKGELILTQFADALVRFDPDIPRRWDQIVTEDLHKGGFATAICADQTIAIAATEFDGDIFKQGLGPKLHGNVSGCDHNKIPKGKE
jgi:hypothetical protein